MKRKKLHRGFTLIELLMVVSIISILSAITLSSLAEARAKARDSQRLANFDQMEKVFQLYLNDNGRYPVPETFGSGYYTTDPDCQTPLGDKITLLRDEFVPKYISEIPRDPLSSALNRCYGYHTDSTGSFYVYFGWNAMERPMPTEQWQAQGHVLGYGSDPARTIVVTSHNN